MIWYASTYDEVSYRNIFPSNLLRLFDKNKKFYEWMADLKSIDDKFNMLVKDSGHFPNFYLKKIEDQEV